VSGLRKIIEQEIHDCGPIPFSRYMELCLYHPQLGYYSRNAEQFGKGGDFFTSSDVHAVFGRLLARQFDEMWRALGSPSEITIQELGPGRGLFAQDVLDWSAKKFPEFFHGLRYRLIEQSAALRQRMAETLKSHFDSGKVSFGSAHDRAKAPAIVFANEFFDAFPVDVVSSQGSLRIGARDGRFVESWVRTSTEELEFLDRYSVHPGEDERVEVSLAAQQHLYSMCNFDHGFMIVIDYGYTREEQVAGRHRGTVKSIRRHSVSASPYEAPGEQDITADVNFTALRDAAERQGVDVQKLVTQAQFLMGIGEANQFADAFEDSRMPQERAKVALQLKHLVTPAGIGESFRVLIMSKGVEEGKARRLAGLNFGKRLG
jgi:SAM-dependent MidA family methyltransferase